MHLDVRPTFLPIAVTKDAEKRLTCLPGGHGPPLWAVKVGPQAGT